MENIVVNDNLRILNSKIPVTGIFEFHNSIFEINSYDYLNITNNKYGDLYISDMYGNFISKTNIRSTAIIFDDFGLLDYSSDEDEKQKQKIMDDFEQQILDFAKIIYKKAEVLSLQYQKEKIKEYPQLKALPSNAVLLSEYFDGKKVIRSYNLWNDEKKILYQFITENGGEPLYTRGVYNASWNFRDFWKAINNGINTYAGAKYKSKHQDKMYSRDRIF